MNFVTYHPVPHCPHRIAPDREMCCYCGDEATVRVVSVPVQGHGPHLVKGLMEQKATWLLPCPERTNTEAVEVPVP